MSENKCKSADVIVVGGGAAGMLAAVTAGRLGKRVLLIERNGVCGKKLRITGKGRCNLTNDCTAEEFLQNVPTNPKFLYSAIRRFSTADTKDFFEAAGVPLKVERGKRVFPVSDRAEDVVNALVRETAAAGVCRAVGRVKELLTENGRISGVVTDSGEKYFAQSVILATGGKSYPGTGSDGDGYKLALSAGHTVTKILPSLVPITSKSRICGELQGLSLKNTALSVIDKTDGKKIYSDFGEMMFTHFGITGPMVLSASAHIPDIGSGRYEAVIDMKPALDFAELDKRILSDFGKYSNKDFGNSLDDLLPRKMIPVVVELSGIDPFKKVNTVTKEERHRLCDTVKGLRIPLSGFRPIAEAIITKGGVSTKEINPKTMESKLCSGLYFAGEIIDVDAYTGGFNLQIAFSTAVLAGENA